MVASVGFMDGRLPFVGMRLKCNYLCVSYIVEVFYLDYLIIGIYG